MVSFGSMNTVGCFWLRSPAGRYIRANLLSPGSFSLMYRKADSLRFGISASSAVW